MNGITIDKRKIFLIDGIGALITCFFLSVVFVRLEAMFRVPFHVLYILALLPALFSIYSLVCYLALKQNFKPFLRGIAAMNFMYCVLTTSVLFVFNQEITRLAWLYFSIELTLIVGLIIWELRASAG